MPLPAILSGATPLAIGEDALSRLVLRAGAKAAARIKQFDDPSIRTLSDIVARTSHKYDVSGGVATIPMDGLIIDQQDPLLDLWGEASTITPQLADAVRAADARDDVRAIVIQADSPGGSVLGLQNAYEAIRDARKPVTVAVTGDLCSAALYIAAAADRIVADPAARIGSIGTMTVVPDVSAMLAQMGVTMHLVATGPHKGTGTPGTPITAERLRPIQAHVDALAAQFCAAVAEGRGLTPDAVQALATGEYWTAGRALELGLIDALSTTPLAAAGASAKELSMLTKDQYKALLAAHSAHAALIDRLDAAGKSEGEVLAALREADVTAKADRITALEADLAKSKTDALVAVKAEQDAHAVTKAQLATITAKHDALAKLAGGTRDPGGAPPNGGQPAVPMSRAEFLKLSPEQRRLHALGGGTVTDA